MIKCNWPRKLGALSIELCGSLVAMSVFLSGARAAETPAAASDALDEITVTGSLIKDPNHESSSPIVITTTDDLKQSGTLTLESALNQLPQFSPSGTAANGGQGTGGHATVNLHGLGANRNLVLLDGRRLPPTDIFGDVEDIDMHESTVSRATANKYVHTPQGLFELKFFFQSGLHSGNGEDVASESVKEKIRGIIAAEDQRKPYSDQHIAAALSNDSIEIARRTVAKYREAMGILPSSKRRQPFLRK